MDMLILFMLFCSFTPAALWARRRAWAMLHLLFTIGMWAFFVIGVVDTNVGSALNIMLAVMFYGNLIFAEVAIIRWCMDFGNDLKKRKRAFYVISSK